MRLNLFTLLRGGNYHNKLYYDKSLSFYISKKKSEQFLLQFASRPRFIHTSTCLYKFVIDRSKVPKLREEHIEEQFIQGHGPGGQNVNRLKNCVLLRHIPTGIVVKCHQDRLQQRNRRLARELLIERLDVHYNGADSVVEQTKRLEQAKELAKKQQAANLRERKQQYKEALQQKGQINKSTSFQSEDESTVETPSDNCSKESQ